MKTKNNKQLAPTESKVIYADKHDWQTQRDKNQ